MTMNASAPTTAPMTSSSGGADARASALKASLEGSDPAAPSEPTGESSATPPGGASSPVDSGAGAPAADQITQDRMKRIAAVRARDEANEAKQREQAKRHAGDGEMEKLRKRIAELEPNEKVFSSEEALLAAAESKGLTPEKLIAWMRTRLTDPAAVAQRATMTEAEKIRAEMKAQDEKHAAEIAALKREREEAQENAAAETMTVRFIGSAQAKAATHPRTAKLFETYKEAGLIGFANEYVAPRLPRGYSEDELHDHVEQLLTDLQAFSGPATAPSPNPAAAGASRTSTKNGAGQPATTLSNALTSGRDTLVESVPLNKLPIEDRMARLKAKLDSE